VVFGLVWGILALPRTDAWIAGAVAVAAGGLLHTGLGGRRGLRVRLPGLVAFIPFFLSQSLRGGADVARRALSPSLPLDTGFLRYRTRLPQGPARILFVNCISLLPGTFSAELRDGAIRVHLLTRDDEAPRRLARLEGKVAGLFGIILPPPETP
jgi:multicomponent Na+:H+ antiporter subunit E